MDCGNAGTDSTLPYFCVSALAVDKVACVELMHDISAILHDESNCYESKPSFEDEEGMSVFYLTSFSFLTSCDLPESDLA